MKISSLAMALFGAMALAGGSQAAEPLKICAAENELPYSNKEGQGFENKLADLLGKELGRPVENVWWTDARYFVRDLLDKGQCDVVLGVDEGDPRMATTKPYYRSGYVFVYPKDKAGQFKDWDSEALKTAGRIAFMPDTPPDAMLKKLGRWNDMFNYMHSLVDYKAKRNQYVRYDPARLVGDVAAGKAEVAVLWGPLAGRYIKEAAKPLAYTVIPDNNTRADGQKVPHQFNASMGVRKNDKALLNALNKAISKQQAAITALLKAEGVPLLPLGNNAVAGLSTDSAR
jgi:mxaJ protein